MGPPHRLTVLCLATLIIFSSVCGNASGEDDDGSEFEKADGEHIWPLLFLVAGSQSIHYSSVLLLGVVCVAAILVLKYC